MMKHNNSSTRRRKSRKSLRSRKWQTRHTKRLQRRRYNQRRRRTYKLRGGAQYAALPALTQPPMPLIPSVTPTNPALVNAQISAQNNVQLEANRKLAGGGSKKIKQRGGNVPTCAASVINGLDGYGYLPPVNCTMVPNTNDPTAQILANSTTTTLVKNIVAAAGDK